MSEQQERPTEQTATTPASEAEHEQRAPVQQREPSQYDTAMLIADQLNETAVGVRKQIEQIVRALGRTQARALLEETMQIEAQDGMLVPDGSRRRTIGGVFLYLAYTKGTTKDGSILRRYPPKAARAKNHSEQPVAPSVTEKKSTPSVPTPSPFLWEDRIALIQSIIERGTATTMKITIIGTFGQIVDKGACIVGMMESSDKIPALPKGVPAPQEIKTNYVVYIGAKQWKNVATAASDAEDAFIIEGYPQVDSQARAISVFATNMTTKKLQAAKRQGQ